MNFLNRLRFIAQGLGQQFVSWGLATLLVNSILDKESLAVAGLSVMGVGFIMLVFALTGKAE